MVKKIKRLMDNPHGFNDDPSVISLMLLDGQWRERIDLQIVDLTVSRRLSDAGDGEIDVFIGNEPEVDGWLQPWGATLVLLYGDNPLWGGVVVKRKTPVGSPELTLKVREWSYWLEKVWTTEPIEFSPAADTTDGGAVVWDRVQKAVSLASGSQLVPPLALGGWAGAAGVDIDVEFLDQTYEKSPQTIKDEIKQVADLGVQWTFVWTVLPDGRFVPRLVTTKFDPNKTPKDILIGSDIADATFEWDGEEQFTTVKVLGAYEVEAARTASGLPYPPLWTVKSYEHLGELADTDAEAQARVDQYADALLDGLKQPLLTVQSVKFPLLVSGYDPGDLVRVVLEEGWDNRFYQGMSGLLRIEEITYEVSNGTQPLTTTFSLTAPLEGLGNIPGG